MPINALLIDSDDTLTRVTSDHVYSEGVYKALTSLLHEKGQVTNLSFDEISQQQIELYHAGECVYSSFAATFDLDTLHLFRTYHDHVDDSVVAHDTESGALLRQLRVPALIFTDAARIWHERRADLIGHGLPASTRDDGDTLQNRKTKCDLRWQRAVDKLSDMAGITLQPSEIAVIDDSASVLRQAQKLGFITIHCHWGYPDRDDTTEFDHSVRSVGDFLLAQNLIVA